MNTYKSKNTQFVESLCDAEEALSYLNYSLNWNKDEFLFALCNVVIAQGGFVKLAEGTGFGKESLYKALTAGNDPRFDTIFTIVRTLGYNFQLTADKQHYRGKQKLIRQNSLAHLYGNLALEWHPTKNNLTPNDVLPGSKKKIWWECSKNKAHTWQASCNARISSHINGCPFCNLKNNADHE